jgi:hypothetical protein
MSRFIMIMIARLVPFGFQKLDRAWSGIDDYDEYLAKQKWIRETFAIVPIDLELFSWMQPDFNLAQYLKEIRAGDALV